MVQVTVAEGVLEGQVVENEYGGTFNSFKGIPFAEPPIGDLRFKAPRPVKPWDGIRSATEHGPISYQYDIFSGSSGPSGSEDCLYLNVYTPEIDPVAPLPVMVFIHGGAFTCGSGNDNLYGPEFLVKQGVILVTINYRVEVLGFLCLNTEDVPGNAGMKDQVAALRWVKKNISSFGGDPENITIFGESAGGASVTYHLLSPMSKGLFKRAIAQSGTATCWWSFAFEPRERAIALARKLGLESENDKELYEFFKSQPKESLIQINVPITLTEVAKVTRDMEFGVVSEEEFGANERFFYGDVFDALRNGVHEGVEIIAGFNEDEGFMGLSADLQKIFEQANNYREFLVPKPISLNCTISQILEVGRKMRKFYFKNENVSMQNLEQLVKFYGMSMFNYGPVEWQKICSRITKSKTYFYKFTCKSERNFMAAKLGLGPLIGDKAVTCHTDDLSYMFPIKGTPKVEANSKTFKMINNVVKLWTNFAKYGNPTPDDSLGVKWVPFTEEKQDYLDIGEELVPSNGPNREEIEFWEKIYKQYLPSQVA